MKVAFKNQAQKRIDHSSMIIMNKQAGNRNWHWPNFKSRVHIQVVINIDSDALAILQLLIMIIWLN